VVDPFLSGSLESDTIIDRFRGICVDYASDKLDPSCVPSLSDIQFLSCVFAMMRLPEDERLSKLQDLDEKHSGLPQQLCGDVSLYRAVIIAPSQFRGTLTHPSSNIGLFAAIRSAADNLLLGVHLCECALLEAIVKREASSNAKGSTFYPSSDKGVFGKVATENLCTRFSATAKHRYIMLETMRDRATEFLSAFRGIPGIRNDLTYVDFQPAKSWPHNTISNFPTSPQDVRVVLNERMAIWDLIEESGHVDLCQNCGAVAVRVCRVCKGLVLCKSCYFPGCSCPTPGCEGILQ
jgi:hypothetical protein